MSPLFWVGEIIRLPNMAARSFIFHFGIAPVLFVSVFIKFFHLFL